MNPLLLGLMKYEGVVQGIERTERWKVYAEAKQYAENTGKPFLVAGMARFPFAHEPLGDGCGDVCIDINPRVVKVAKGDWLGIGAVGETADIKHIPYPDKYFGSAFCSHTLEHLEDIEDCEVAVNELNRVSDRIFIVSPHKWSIIAWLAPSHHLWVGEDEEGNIFAEQR